MKKTIRIHCIDDGPWYSNGLPNYVNWVQNKYNFILDPVNPEIVFYSCYGTEFLKFNNCIRVFYTGENVRPDFNFCDYAIAYDRMSFGERYIRKGNYVCKPPLDSNIDYAKRKFCNFIYSNDNSGSGAKLRIDFCKFLSRYKRIDCPGRVLNNMSNAISPRQGNFAEGKLKFIADYKFTLAWENSFYPGYITEKLIHPFMANSIPIYMGDPDVEIDFNPKAFINCNKFKTWDDIVEYIIYLDNNDKEYLSMLSQPALNAQYIEPDIPGFIQNIIENGTIYEKNVHNNVFMQPYHRQQQCINLLGSTLVLYENSNTDFKQMLDKYLYFNVYTQDLQFEELLKKLKMHMESDHELVDYLMKSGRINEHQMAIIKAASAYTRSFKGRDIIWKHTESIYNKYKDLMALLWPHDALNLKKTRIGDKNNGGVVALETNEQGIALSIGFKGTGLWELKLAETGWKVFQFSEKLSSSQRQHPNLVWNPLRVVPDNPLSGEITLQQIIDKYVIDEPLILHIDIEGDEWELIESITPDLLQRFSQLYCEFHRVTNQNLIDTYITLLKKISLSHIPVHIHYNNNGQIIGLPDFLISSLIEITYARRDLDIFSPSEESFPTPLDAPTLPNIPDIYIGKFSDILGVSSQAAYFAPPKEIPENLYDRYTNNGTIPVQKWYFDSRRYTPITNSRQIYADTLNAIKARTFKYYDDTINYIYDALNDFPIEGKRTLISCLLGCNCDAIAIYYNAREVIVCDYNLPVCEHDKVKVMGIDEFENTNIKIEAAFSISSYEHDGLGRYGDPLDPEGDFRAMKKLHSKMAPNGILYLAVPVGADCLAWNAHRIYGPLRLPQLIKGWGFLSSYGMNPGLYDYPLGRAAPQPLFVLSANPYASNIPHSVNKTQKEQINVIASSKAFDSGWYLEKYPDVLSAQMDPVSHYVLYGENENRFPNSWFDVSAYRRDNYGIGWDLVNSFAHFLKKGQL